MQPNEEVDALVSRWHEALRRGEDISTTELCAGRPDLLPEVERHLDAFRGMERLVHGVLPETLGTAELPPSATATSPGEAVPSVQAPLPALPGFDVEAELGRGGMGVVYRAYDRRLRRTVAVKHLLVGRLGSPEQVARFRAEAQALARLQHPNIVQVFDAGENDGQPFFVLEFCPGGSLAERLAGAPLPPDAAAAVCERLAGAVQVAHDNRIVHRDLKPQNVLLADGPEVPLTSARLKVSDFGLAKNLDEAGLSGTDAVLGTPSYMAPEQTRPTNRSSAAGGDGVGPATDVWALGAILYELLTGRPPFKAATAIETLIQVVEDDPAPPRTVNPKVPRDLETICLKCLRKEPARRYGTAAELAGDLRRFLDGRPVLARPVGAAERFVRWCARNPRVAALAASLLLLLVGSLVSVTALYLRADGERRRAEASGAEADAARRAAEASAAEAREQEAHARSEADKARSIVELLTVIFEGADTLGLGDSVFSLQPLSTHQPTAVEVVDRGAAMVDSRSDLPPEVRAALLDAIGTVYSVRGQYEKGEKYLREACELRRRTPGVPPLDLASSLHHLGRLLTDRSGHRDAEGLLREALRLRREHGADALAVSETQLNLGLLLVLQGEPEEAEPLLREAIDRCRERLGDDHPRIGSARLGLAACHIELGQWPAAAAEIEKATRIIREKSRDDSLGEAIALFQGAVFKSLVRGDQAGAEKDLKESLRLARRGWGEGHFYTAIPLFQLGTVYEEQGKPREAEAAYRECLEIVRKRQALGHPRVFLLIAHLAGLRGERGDAKEAGRLLAEGTGALRRAYGDDHVVLADVLVQSAGVRARLWDAATREKELTEAIRIYEKAGAPARLMYATALNNLGWVRRDQGRMDEAADLFRRSLAVERRRSRGDAHNLSIVLSNLIDCRMTQGVFDDEVSGLLGALEEATRKLAWTKHHNLALARLLALRAWNHRHHGRHVEAAADAVACRRRNARDGDALYRAACVLGGCAALAAKAGPAEETLARQYADEAMTALRQAVRDGYADRRQIENEPDLAPLRQRADYAALLREMAAKNP